MMRRGPDFIGIGAQKAATTWLYQCLKMHHDVDFPSGKEIHFWDRRDRNGRPIKEYEDIFSGYQAKHIDSKQGDITPAYMLISDDRIAEVKELAPDVRLILVVRNPVDRAISAALQALRARGVDPATCGERRIDGLLRSNFITECGLYAKHLQRWLCYFSHDQFHVVLNDEIGADPRGAAKRAATHIGADPNFYDMIDVRLLGKKASPTREQLPVADDTRGRLLERYLHDIEDLERIIGRELPWRGKVEVPAPAPVALDAITPPPPTPTSDCRRPH